MGNETKGKWTPNAFYINAVVQNVQRPIFEMVIGGRKGEGIPYISITELQENSELVCEAVNQCKSLNKDNPLVVAESIKEMVDCLKTFTSGYSCFSEYSQLSPSYDGRIEKVFEILNKISEVK